MESFDTREAITELTLDLLCEPEFADGPSAGIVLQAYLVDSPEYLDELLAWARAHPRAHPFTIRLVKGAYWDHEVVQAAQHGWTPPVFTDRRACDRNFEELTRRLIDAQPTVRVAIASHNLRSIAAAAAYADARGADVEFQILRGPRRRHAGRDAATGRRVRSYCPVGDLVAGMAYLVRRLLENTANDSFLAAHAEGVDPPPSWRRHERHDPVRQRAAARAAPRRGPRRGHRGAGRARRQAAARGPDADRDRARAGRAFASVDPSPRPASSPTPTRRPRARRRRDRRARRGPAGLVARSAAERAALLAAPPASCAAAASSSPRWPSARAASRGPRPTPTSARRSTSSSTTPPARSRWTAAARCCSCRASATRCATCRAASPA